MTFQGDLWKHKSSNGIFFHTLEFLSLHKSYFSEGKLMLLLDFCLDLLVHAFIFIFLWLVLGFQIWEEKRKSSKWNYPVQSPISQGRTWREKKHQNRQTETHSMRLELVSYKSSSGQISSQKPIFLTP